MPKAFTENEKGRIRERLLEEGERQFARYGLKKTTVEELAAAVGISKAAFYLFYPSKEALFMEVVEAAEVQFRREVLAVIEQPGPSPRRRLAAAFQTAFRLWKTIPVLRFFTSQEYALIARKLPEDSVHEHQAGDRAFIAELVERSRAAGIPIRAGVDEIGALLYTLFFANLHADDFGPGALDPALDILIELTAAFCLGEVAIEDLPARPETEYEHDPRS